MKKLDLLLIAMVISYTVVFSQGCLPEGITFYTQGQIDNFQTNYPGCTEILGDVDINYSITNLVGLNSLITIGGHLAIEMNFGLTSLMGLENLSTIEGYFNIYNNISLTNLVGLENLTYIGSGFNISLNYITSLDGLENLTFIGGQLYIENNFDLTNLSALENLTTIGGYLQIESNNALNSLSGLENIDAGSISNLNIFNNSSLSACDVQSICEYLAAPNGTIEIHDNFTGCNNQAEVEAACLTSIKENISKEEITLFPNPATTFITIQIKEGIPVEEAIIYNHLGQKALEAKPVNNTVDVSGLRPGMYVLEVVIENRIIREILLVE